MLTSGSPVDSPVAPADWLGQQPKPERPGDVFTPTPVAWRPSS